MDVFLHWITISFLFLAGLIAFCSYRKDKRIIWLLTGVVFELQMITNIFDLQSYVGAWLLSGGFGIVDFADKYLNWFKLYKHSAIVYDFLFIIAGILIIIGIYPFIKRIFFSRLFLWIAVVSFVLVVTLGIIIPVFELTSYKAFLIQRFKDTFEAIGSFSLFVCFLIFVHS